MKKYVAKRLAISVLLIFIISVFSFMLIHILPGDPARLALGYEASEADVQAYRVELHLDKPLVTQYVLWIKGLFQGDFGRSILYNRPNLDILAERLPPHVGHWPARPVDFNPAGYFSRRHLRGAPRQSG